MNEFYPVILCGGSGSRLWPLSRKNHPKQFLKLYGEQSLFQNTLRRISDKQSFKLPTLVCNHEYKNEICMQAQQIHTPINDIILEPVGKNTAPALAVAAFHLNQNNTDPIMIAMPSDHIISDTNAFHATLEHAKKIANENMIVTLGIHPTGANRNYGYILSGDYINEDHHAYKIESFIEKPNEKTAKDLIARGACYWNSGIFIFKASTFLTELQQHAPEIYTACKMAVNRSSQKDNTILLDENSFKKCPSISIDYAVMEKTDKAAIIPLNSDWDDVGSWSSIWNKSPRDTDGTATIGDVLTRDVKDSYLYATHRCLAVIGADNLVVIETPDAVLVSNKDELHKIKDVYAQLQSGGRAEIENHVHKTTPWGKHNTLLKKPNATVKHITLNTMQEYNSINKTLHVLNGTVQSTDKTYKTGDVITGETLIKNKSPMAAEIIEIELLSANMPAFQEQDQP